MPEFLTYNDVAAALQVSRMHVHNLVRRGILRSLTVGRTRRIPRSELERLAQSATIMQPSTGHLTITPLKGDRQP